MSITATLAAPSQVIAGRPAVFMITVTNAASSDVTVSSVRAVITGGSTPGNQAVHVAPPQFPPGRTSTVAASNGTLSFPVDAVFYFPQTPGNSAAMPGSTYLVDFIVQVSDGSICSITVPQWVAVSSGAPSPSQGYGQFRFDDGLNLINLAVL